MKIDESNSREIRTSAPGKLMLFGEHAVVYGHPCIVTAVNQRIEVGLRKNPTRLFNLSAPDMGLESYSKAIDDLGRGHLPKAVRFIEMVYKRFLERYPQKEGVVGVTRSDFSSKFGFGSSSAVTVAFAKALTTLYGLEIRNKELFDLCYQAVIDVQGVGSGFDLAAAIWGGTIYYVSPAEVVEDLGVDNLPIVVGYTGVKADTTSLVRMVAEKKELKPERVGRIFDEISLIVERAKRAIKVKDWQGVGELMNSNQKLLVELGVSSIELDKLIRGSINTGSSGAKLSGAGGGDCMLAIRDNLNKETSDKVELAIITAGGVVMDVGLNAEGVRVE